MRRSLVWFAAIGSLALAGRAEAFCRTTTSPVPLGYDPVASGCWQEGVPLFWPMSRVPYGVAVAGSPLRGISGAEATRIADLAFSAWREARCAGDAGSPNVVGVDDGPIAMVPEAGDCDVSSACDPTLHDVIYFDDGVWPYSDPANTIALTSILYGTEDGKIFEAKTEVNSMMQDVTTVEPPPAGGYDLQSVLTHEAGHFFGLAHATETTSIMYAYYQGGATALTSDDVSGICAIYPPSGPSGGQCAFVPARARAGSRAPLAAWVAAGVCCAARRRRTRKRSWRLSQVQ